ncbi:hypothetical protein CC2G_014212 [Coprinopsis cinerea AmutBmut pab1-1]|nr:hypothetical protein CC2G_014212 [Coprinopsis cinerea AmutBmut pab1-1]
MMDEKSKSDTTIAVKPVQDIEMTSAPGLHFNPALEKALEECRQKVEAIAKDCRGKNVKFRDMEFDLQGDERRCWNAFWGTAARAPTDVLRVTEIFDKPVFFNAAELGKPKSEDIIQGALGDCWFLSALATIASVPGLIEEICVARDEEVGVYGFVFHRDGLWKPVIIDDLLFTNIPKYEELKEVEKELYHHDKDLYTKLARKGKKILTYAKSGAQDETWVPLIEKAYAKFYCNYDHLNGGWTGEAIEDLTGGIAKVIEVKDILNIDQFWTEELLNANRDRVFACAFHQLDSSRNGVGNARVQGLVGSHAYSVLRAVECKGKRFLVVRNPWGDSEWTGPWADGSKEWDSEWVKILPELGHQFGDDGQFVMEYCDFLRCFEIIERTLLLDSSWKLASKWLQVPLPPAGVPPSFGDISFELTIPTSSKTIMVLSKLNQRFFRSANDWVSYTMDFAVVKVGQSTPLGTSTAILRGNRSISLELDLEPGTYRVYARLDTWEYILGQNIPLNRSLDDYVPGRDLARFISNKIEATQIAPNAYTSAVAKFRALTLEEVIARDNKKDNASALRKLINKMSHNRSRRSAFPEVAHSHDGTFESDLREVLVDGNKPIVGLKVYTKSATAATVKARLNDDRYF